MIPCPRTTICNKCEQINTSGAILNAGDNADGKEIFGFSESYFKIAPRHLDECTKSKLLNLQQDNMRSQRNIEINDKIPDEKYQNNNPDDKKSDDRDQIPKINKTQIIEDEGTVQLKHLSTAIEKINIKESNTEESDKSDTEERDKIQISYEVTMIARNKINDDDDKINKDADQGRSEEESKEKYQTEISKKMLQHQIYQNLGEI